MGFLVKHDGSVTAPLVLLSIGIPLLSAGHYRYTHRGDQEISNRWALVSGLAIILLGCTLCLLAAAAAVNYFALKAKKSQSSEYDWIDDKSTTSEAILNYLQDIIKSSSSATTTPPLTPCLRCLAALTTKISSKKSSKNSSPKRSKLEITCLEASYLILKSFPLSDAAISPSILLLALIAKNNQVRRQHANNDNNTYGLDIPIAALRLSLQRAKLDEDEDEDKEHTTAELQRRGCLFLGAVADGDSNGGGGGCGLAKMIADRGGLDVALDAVGWYRYHEDVANWALWAVFILCYDHLENQDKLVRLDGIPKICRVMKDHPKSMGVQRHGIAILFDLMREREMGVAATATAMVMNKHQIRMMALNADLHSLVKTAMEHHDKMPEIMMMGRQMLLATGYTGDIPKWRGAD